MVKNSIKSVCVFCGSRDGSNALFKKASFELGILLANENLKLVYGGGNIGLMGALASSAQSNNCNILGVIPEHLMKKEVGKTDLKKLTVTKNMHNRKSLMYKEADAFIILPGGIGTLDEFFEVLTWSQLKIHKKPILLLNIDGFWNPMIDLINHQINFGFVDKSIENLFITVKKPSEAIDYLVLSDRKLSNE